MNVRHLHNIGFEMSFGAGLFLDITVTSPEVQTEGINATHMVDLFCALSLHRNSSMCWHCMSWPGLSVLLGSDDDDIYDSCLKALRVDYMAFQKAAVIANANAYVSSLVATSPFHSRFIWELCTILYTPVMLSWCDIRARLQTFVCTLFSG